METKEERSGSPAALNADELELVSGGVTEEKLTELAKREMLEISKTDRQKLEEDLRRIVEAADLRLQPNAP